MEVHIHYIANRPNYAIGKLYVDGRFFCDTLTPPLRTAYIKGCSAVPCGRYTLSMQYLSPRFSKKKPYCDFAGGHVPRVVGFSGSSNILIHVGNERKDTEGCFLVGENRQVGRVVNSVAAYRALITELAKHPVWDFVID